MKIQLILSALWICLGIFMLFEMSEYKPLSFNIIATGVVYASVVLRKNGFSTFRTEQ